MRASQFAPHHRNARARPPQVCHVVASINTQTGGPARSVARLAEVLAGHDITSHLFTLDYAHLGEQVIPGGVCLHSHPATFVARHFRGLQAGAARQLAYLAATRLDVIHNHGLWMFPNLYARQSALANHLPLVISPRGMLDGWSLKNSRAKKVLAWHLYEKKNLVSASLFHATSVTEAQSIRALGFKQPIALIPNGVDIPRLAELPPKDLLVRSHPELAARHWLLFLSRIHPKKGLANLLIAWEKLSARFEDWQLLIAGPDLTGYRGELEALAESLRLTGRVSFTGMLEGEAKQCAFANAELFVLPTHSENFGMAVAEALSYGIPVVTTQRAPWQVLQDHECGWWIEDDREALTATLAEAMWTASAARREMGLRGRALAEEQFSWEKAAADMADVYRWLLGGGSPPPPLHLNGAIAG